MCDKEKLDYGKTLHLPVTEFPMRGNLPQKEPGILEFWKKEDIYKKRLELRKGCKHFILHDGPPYANGHLHIGHALNKTLKDIIMRYKTLQGYYTPYTPGWDTHGLPIEHAVIKNTGLNRHEISPLELRNRCKEYAIEYVDIQREEFKRFGVDADWDRPYLTFNPEFEVKQIGVFGDMATKGHIYKGLKTVYWCTHCETALAEAEIEYKDKKSFSIYVKFPYVSENNTTLPAGVDKEKAFAVIWTTTPWTMPGNVAISAHKDFDYVWVEMGDEVYLLAKELLENVAKEWGVEHYHILAEVKGNDLEFAKFKHPMAERNVPVILGEHVTLETGTGLVHTASAHGIEDFDVVRDYNEKHNMDIPVLGYVDGNGKYIASVDENRYGDTAPLAGLEIHDAEVPIIKILAHNNRLVHKGSIRHQYAHCWRCKNPVIYRATEQWFASVDGFRKEALEAIDNQVQWIPKWGRDRIYNMVRDRKDWCISRQRAWGVPIPIFNCVKCGKHIIDENTVKSVQDAFAEEGSNAWWSRSAKELLPKDYKCPHCAGEEFTKEEDIMDVWFDSGTTWSGVLEVDGLDVPCSMYLEGADQHRGWFHSSLLTAIASRGFAPYNSVLTHGFVVDGEGRKMSKSVGNTVAPADIIDVYGADVMRLWVSSADYQADIRISPNIIKQLSEVYRKLRNTLRFLLGNLDGFDPNKDAISYENMTEIDKWALHRLEEVRNKVTEAYDNYEFHIMYHTIHNFCTVDLSAIYLDVLKDRMYADAENSLPRRSAQTAMYEILYSLVRMIAPVLSFTAEEVWSYMPKQEGMPISVHLTDWPQAKPEHYNEEIATKWDKLLEIRSELTKILEVARQAKTIGHSLDAAITIYAEGEVYQSLKEMETRLAMLLIVSEAHLVEGLENAPANAEKSPEMALAASVKASEYAKCERCWIHRESVGQNAEHETICERCASVINNK